MADMTVGSASSGLQSLLQRSGSLARGMGFVAVMSFGIAAISLSWSGQLLFSTIPGLWPGANLAIILVLAMLLSLFHAYTYAMIGVAAPRSGADYYLAGKVISKPLAFASSLIMVVFSAVVAGTLLASIPQTALPVLFNTLALVTNQREYFAWAESASRPENVIIIGTIAVVLTFLTQIFSQRSVRQLMALGMGLGLLAWGILYFQLASVPVDAFPGAWNSVMGSGDYLDRIIKARDLGMSYSFDLRATTLAGLVLGAYIFNGYFISTYFAGEVKNPEKNLLPGSLASLLLAFGVFIGGVLLVMRLVPTEWLAAQSYLYLSPAYKDLAMPWITFYAAVLRPIVPLIWIVGIIWVYSLFTLGQAFIFYTSRIILAWTEDRMLPRAVAFIHPTFRSPLLAVLIAALIAELGVVDSSLNSRVTGELNFVIFVVVSQLVPVLAITLLPFLKRDLFAASPRLVQMKLGPVPVISIIGSLTLIYMGWLVAANFIFPAQGGVQPATWLLLIALLLIGVVWYLSRSSYLRGLPQTEPPDSDQLPVE